VSGNPVQFSIADQVVTPVVFRFRDGDEIVVIGSGTLEVSIEVEKGATCQAPLTSCDGACVDVQTDTNNCGSCGAVCAGGAACVNGTCVLECAPPTRDCDSNLINGCETNVSVDLNNCGTCGNVCQAGPNSSPVCQSGTCQITCTSPAFANCDMNPSNGCEVPLDTNPSCGSTGLGDLPGDRPAGSSADGVGERSFRLHVFEDDSGIFSHDLSVGFTLATPPGASYRLEANCDGCGAVVSGNSVVLKWQEESVGFDSGRDVFVNVVYQGGTSCQPWHLQIQTDVPGAFTCSPK
jgi:hypothetical protein